MRDRIGVKTVFNYLYDLCSKSKEPFTIPKGALAHELLLGTTLCESLCQSASFKCPLIVNGRGFITVEPNGFADFYSKWLEDLEKQQKIIQNRPILDSALVQQTWNYNYDVEKFKRNEERKEEMKKQLEEQDKELEKLKQQYKLTQDDIITIREEKQDDDDDDYDDDEDDDDDDEY